MAIYKLGIGVRVRLLDEYVSGEGIVFPVGHELTIKGSSDRGYDLIDDEGNEIAETRFMKERYVGIRPKLKSWEIYKTLEEKQVNLLFYSSEDPEEPQYAMLLEPYRGSGSHGIRFHKYGWGAALRSDEGIHQWIQSNPELFEIVDENFTPHDLKERQTEYEKHIEIHGE